MTTVASVMRSGRRTLDELEQHIVQDLLDQYAIAWRQVARRLTDIEGMIEAAIARGETVDASWLSQQQWWQSVMESIELEMQRYSEAMAQQLGTGQVIAVQTSRQVSGLLSDYLAGKTLKRGVPVPDGIYARINPETFERWVVAQQPDSPIRQAIDRYGDRVSRSVRTRITEGLGAGVGVKAITRRIVADVGEDAVKGRIHTTVRTEVLRAYRGSLRDAMEAFGPDVVTGWRWLATLSRRTCPACLAMHNREFPFDHYPDQFHVGCRCSVVPAVNPAIVPRRLPGQTGEQWLRKQPEAVQRRVLKSKDRYGAFKAGTPLGDFVEVTHDDTWGDSIGLKPMAKMR